MFSPSGTQSERLEFYNTRADVIKGKFDSDYPQ